MPGEYSYIGLEKIDLLTKAFQDPDTISAYSGPSNNDIIDKINEISKKVNILIDLEDSRINRKQ